MQQNQLKMNKTKQIQNKTKHDKTIHRNAE